ncbi:MAG: hypothetical protein LBB76_02740 [Azoarcus sp.]|jgi:hypothetical protein|nr:hypothetical protein [Azoarcus sp.]
MLGAIADNLPFSAKTLKENIVARFRAGNRRWRNRIIKIWHNNKPNSKAQSKDTI